MGHLGINKYLGSTKPLSNSLSAKVEYHNLYLLFDPKKFNELLNLRQI